MADLRPFRALRPAPEKVEEVACVPYDVIDSAEARQLAEGKPLSFLHIIRPEIDLDPDVGEHDERVYQKGAENLRKYVESESSVIEAKPALYVYRLIMDGEPQTGIYGCVSVRDYDEDVILKHEKTRPAKEDDRTRHIVTQRAHAEPVMLTFRATSEVQNRIDDAQKHPALYDFLAEDGVRHTIWRVQDPGAMEADFSLIDRMYVADGHHRCKAASRAAQELRGGGRGDEEWEFFPAVLFPMEEMRILPYNRVVYELAGSKADFLEEMRKRFDVESGVKPEPQRKGDVCLYLGDEWHRFHLPSSERPTIADSLDVARLNEFVLEPLLGVNDPRTDENLGFVGGIRGTAELERLVDSDRAALAFSMYPTSVEELVFVSDDHLLMPPKSTWFEPKLRSGMLVHLFE